MASPFYKRPPLIALLVGLVALALYAPTWSYGALNYDDAWLVRDNPTLSRLDLPTLKAIFFDLSRETRFTLGSEYLPLRDLSIAIDHALFGAHFGAFHAVQTLLYALACALLFWGLWRWTRRLELSSFAALIFVTHPLHVESVAWLSERKGVLALLFFSLTLLAFHRFLHSEGSRRSWRWLILSALAATAALWSKGLAIATLGLLLVLVLLFSEGAARRRGLLGFATITPLVALAFLPTWITGGRMEMVGDFHGGSFGATLALAAKAHALYLSRAALWGESGIVYPLRADGSGLAQIMLGAAGALIALGALLYGIRRALRSNAGQTPEATARDLTTRYWALAAAIWLGFLLPVSHLLFPLQNAAADRYTLLPTLGWSLAAALALGLLTRPRLRVSLLLLLCLAQGASTLLLSRAWRSDEALYTQALRAHPRYLPAMLQLARIAREQRAPKEAHRWLQRARAIAPDDHRLLTHQALLLLAKGHMTGAIRDLRRAAKHKDAHRARANLALLLLRRGENEEALRLAREGAQLRPLGHHAQHTLGVVALRLRALDEAERALKLALRLKRKHAPTHFNLATLALQRGERQSARSHLRRALEIAPTFRPALRLRRAMDVDDARGKR